MTADVISWYFHSNIILQPGTSQLITRNSSSELSLAVTGSEFVTAQLACVFGCSTSNFKESIMHRAMIMFCHAGITNLWQTATWATTVLSRRPGPPLITQLCIINLPSITTNVERSAQSYTNVCDHSLNFFSDLTWSMERVAWAYVKIIRVYFFSVSVVLFILFATKQWVLNSYGSGNYPLMQNESFESTLN